MGCVYFCVCLFVCVKTCVCVIVCVSLWCRISTTRCRVPEIFCTEKFDLFLKQYFKFLYIGNLKYTSIP